MDTKKMTTRIRADLQVLDELIIPKLKEVSQNGNHEEFGRMSERYGILVRDLYLALDSSNDPICLPPYISICRYKDDVQRGGTPEFGYMPEDVEFWSQGDAILYFHKYLDEKGVFDDVRS